MATKRFNPDVALDRAVDAFWECGYEATSAQDLVDAMGISRASLYDTFGNKAALYEAALERYRSRTAAILEGALDEREALASIRRFLDAQAAELTGDPLCRGCFLTNATTEMATRNPEIAALVRDSFDHTRATLTQTLTAAQDAGDVRTDTSAAALADYLLSIVQGLHVLGKSGAPLNRLQHTIDLALDTLEPRRGA